MKLTRNEAPTAEAIEGEDKQPGTSTYEVAEPRYDSEGKITEIVLKLEDGRMVPATIGDKLELAKGDILKTSTVTVKHEGLTDDGVPAKPVVTKVDR